MQSEDLVDKAISNYKNAIERYYETKSFLSLNHMASSDVDKFLKHIKPLMEKLYQTISKEAPEVNKEGTLDDFLLNFAEIGAKEDEKEPYEVKRLDGKKVPRGENKYRIHLHIVSICTNDASNWNYDSYLRDEHLNTLSARKLYALTLLGINKFEQHNFDEYDKTRIKEGHSIIGNEPDEDGSSHIDKGGYDLAVDFFKEKLVLLELPQALTEGLLKFYRKFYEPARTQLEFVIKTIKAGPPYAANNNNHNGSEKDIMWSHR